MLIPANEPCPLPDDPVLAEAAAALNETNQWGWVLDAEGRIAYLTDDQRLSFGAGVEMVPTHVGVHLYSTEMVDLMLTWRTGPTSLDAVGAQLSLVAGQMGGLMTGGIETFRAAVDSRLVDLVADIEPTDQTVLHTRHYATGMLRDAVIEGLSIRLNGPEGEARGLVMVWKPSANMTLLGWMAYEQDLDHLQRILAVGRAGRRPAAIAFGDLEGSSALARTLSTGSYFSLVRRIVRATDQAIVDNGGVVGRHVGDGVVAFFPVESAGSESAAARNCIAAAIAVRESLADVAERSGLPAEDLVVRFGLHWGSTLHMGSISTVARAEVTALGDEVNEGARIEACAAGGLTLASKPLIERLDDDDAAALGIDPDAVSYTQLADLATATEKARRDAPAIAVCEL